MSFGPVRWLIVAAALLAGGLAWMWFDEAGNLRNLSWMAPAPLTSAILLKPDSARPGASPANPTQYLAVLERPVFAPDRRPPPPPVPPPPPDPMANIQVMGIFSGDTPGIIANIEGKQRRVRVNETIGAWTLKTIEGRDVTFEQGADKRQLRLAYSRLGPVLAQASVAGAAPVGQLNASVAPNAQDEGRERLRRVNAIRAANGMKPLAE